MRVKWKEGVGRKVMNGKHEEKTKKTEAKYIHTHTHTYVYTRAFTNLCTDIKMKKNLWRKQISPCVTEVLGL